MLILILENVGRCFSGGWSKLQDADEFRTYILGIVFYKYLSEKIDQLF